MKKKLRLGLKRLRKAAVAAAGPWYVPEGESYQPAVDPLYNMCGVVAVAVRRRYGGQIVGVKANVGNELVTHVWNILPDGTEVDLTSSQFGGDGFNPFPQFKGLGKPAQVPSDEPVYAQFYEEVKWAL